MIAPVQPVMRRKASNEAREGLRCCGRWWLSALLSAAACDARCAGPPATAESSPPAAPPVAAEEVAPEVGKPVKEVHITAADVVDIERGELQIVEAPEYEVRKLGKPKVLMEGKHLRLPDEPWPLAPNRGFVVVQDGPEYGSATIEARLLDLETGEVLATLRRLYRGSYTKLGVALGEAEVDGKQHEVLVHASDGRIVPLWTVEQGKSRFVVINAGTGDAWVFAEQEGAGEEEPPYRYAYWPDLRKSPPEPSELFAHELDDSAGSTPGGWLGPTTLDPAAAPLSLQVKGDDDECRKIELRADGYKCMPGNWWAMADGWRGKLDREEEKYLPIMEHAERGEVQYLEIGQGCAIEEVTLDPPRAVLRCNDSKDRFLWAPERVVRVPREVNLGSDTWSRDRHVRETTHHSYPEDVPLSTNWLDFVEMRAIGYHPVRNLTPYAMDRKVVFADPEDQLFVFDIVLGQAQKFANRTQVCARISDLAVALPLFAYDCHEPSDSVRWTEVVDLERNKIWRLPVLRDVWLLPSIQRIVAVSSSGRGQRVSNWALQ
jgi:hypothetical protein